MITLENHFNNSPKKEIYKFYQKIIPKSEDYDNITRASIYQKIIHAYKMDPEIILKMCTIEEINALRNLLEKKKDTKNIGYIENIIYTNLADNYLILQENNTYYLPSDIKNYIKMALNLYDEKMYSLKDITDSVLIGLIRIYNAIKLDDFANIVNNYNINISKNILKKYIFENLKLKSLIQVIKFQNEYYVISLENMFYKELIPLISKHYDYKIYSLEEVLSIGKYKINLFKSEIFNFLTYLENYIETPSVNNIIHDLIIYCGLDIDDDEVLNSIACNIPDLLGALQDISPYFPMWIYKGCDLITLSDYLIIPNRNDLCLCGSGKKYKNCCGKTSIIKTIYNLFHKSNNNYPK